MRVGQGARGGLRAIAIAIPVLKHNSDISSRIVPSKATSEQYSVFRSYIDARHGDGGMADMTVLDYSAMVDDSFVDSHLVEYRTRDNRLACAMLTDILEDGISLIYSFYDPDDAIAASAHS